MNEEKFGRLSANVDTLIEQGRLLQETQQTLLNDVAVLKITVPRNVSMQDQDGKTVIRYVAEIFKWAAILATIIFGAGGADKFIK